MNVREQETEKNRTKEILIIAIKAVLTIGVIFVSIYTGVLSGLILGSVGINPVISFISTLVVPSLFLPLIWLRNRKKFIVIWLIVLLNIIIHLMVTVF